MILLKRSTISLYYFKLILEKKQDRLEVFMKEGRKYSEYEISMIANTALGKTFRQIEKEDLTTFEEKQVQKGSLGQIIETALYGIETNSESEPDFIDAGVELKVTPYRKNKNNSLSAKERLVLNIINYMTEYANSFENSHFWFKNHKLEILWYLYEENKDNLDFVLTHANLIDLEVSEDLKQIEKDWNTIIDKIKAGKAHEISEADTMYLGACTKGESKKSVRTQPFSDIKAKQRAFCFKQSYMTQLVRKYIGDYRNVEKILKNSSDTFDSFVNRVVNKYKGKTQMELIQELGINPNCNSKAIFMMIVNRMFQVKSKLKNTEEFQKAKIIPKTIRVEENGMIEQSMSFPYFSFEYIFNTDFEDSTFREELETTKYMFFVFKKEKGEYVFKGIKLWNMPENVIDTSVKEMYDKTREVIRTGNIVNHINKNGSRATNFPGKKANAVCHVRPHGQNTADTIPLPVKDKLTGADRYTKQCFWFNNNYVKEIIADIIK